MEKSTSAPIRKSFWVRKKEFLGGISVFLFSFLLCLLYGRIGFNPLDNSIVFDGAWRLLQGQHFFEDFATPNGFVPISIQAGFFWVFGVNFFAYVLHAALINGLAAWVGFFLLRKLDVPLGVAFLAGIGTGLVFYTPMGMPYMDQHSFFFCLVAILFTIPSERKWPLYFFPFALILAFFSKQNPAIFYIPGAFFLFFILRKKQLILKDLKYLGMGCLMGVFLILLLFPFVWRHFEDFWLHSFSLPQNLVENRLGEDHFSWASRFRRLFLLPSQVAHPGMRPWELIVWATLVLSILLGVARRFWAKSLPLPQFNGIWVALVLNFGMAFFIPLTQNQRENGIPFFFLVSGFMLAFWWREFPSLGKAFGFGLIPRKWLWGIAAGWIFLGVWTGIRFHFRVNSTRMVADLEAFSASPWSMPQGLSQADFLQYQAPYSWASLQFQPLIAYFHTRPGNFFLFGDCSVLYGLTGRPSVSPWLWFHPGLTYPESSDSNFGRYQNRLVANLKKSAIRFVVFENEARTTYMHEDFCHFPDVYSLLEKGKSAEEKVGGFTVWTLEGE